MPVVPPMVIVGPTVPTVRERRVREEEEEEEEEEEDEEASFDRGRRRRGVDSERGFGGRGASRRRRARGWTTRGDDRRAKTRTRWKRWRRRVGTCTMMMGTC